MPSAEVPAPADGVSSWQTILTPRAGADDRRRAPNAEDAPGLGAMDAGEEREEREGRRPSLAGGRAPFRRDGGAVLMS